VLVNLRDCMNTITKNSVWADSPLTRLPIDLELIIEFNICNAIPTLYFYIFGILDVKAVFRESNDENYSTSGMADIR